MWHNSHIKQHFHIFSMQHYLEEKQELIVYINEANFNPPDSFNLIYCISNSVKMCRWRIVMQNNIL